ncbi:MULTISPECIES: dTDP-4-amino-4,6-dideoxygalactose transaminase [Pseudomonas]|jgi:dTDP-4-amino-4,6-dideoxygalactose transaminase|uniref:dTDP-4-amino-4,6-dideoxygalactose transaminase n=1 Tax=Pseudomonas TaxID=286 RepID=UPI00034AF136|nr:MULTISPECIES: dTDP-4-amino-4,6-dideoxygalactose transaminase [Pseudomonas]
MDNDLIHFNRPYMTGKELFYIAEAKFGNMLAGDGAFTKKCHAWLEEQTKCNKALLTHSCTAALEMAALLLNIEPGDEIIMPSYTFVSTANAFVLRGAIPVFVDIREDTLNIDERLIEAAITSKTKAIVPVHYAGVSCEMDFIMELSKKYNLKVVEDAAQGAMSKYKGKALGSIGDLGALSFHETKNVISGEGGALLVNTSKLAHRAEIIREKGTDRSQFFRGEVDKYTWQEVGSSYLPGELIAAFLWAQLEEAQSITDKRISNWNYYNDSLEGFEKKGILRRPIVPESCTHNAHMYYVLLPESIDRQKVLSDLKKNNILSVFHYIPLHSSPAGQRYGRVHDSMKVTIKQSERLIRLPLWVGLSTEQQDKVVDTLHKSLNTA